MLNLGVSPPLPLPPNAHTHQTPNLVLTLILLYTIYTSYCTVLYHSILGEGVDIGGRAGSRVLCLDGGGVRGLIQIEVLSQVSTELYLMAKIF